MSDPNAQAPMYTPPPNPPMQNGAGHNPTMASQMLSHSMDEKDLDNPMNWPLHRKVYASAVAWAFAASVTFGLTSYTAGIQPIAKEFGFNPMLPIAPIVGFSLYTFGIAFAPIFTPHVTERIGRSIFYLTILPICGLFILGDSLSHHFAGVAVCRFFAGLFGGPCLVLIEGTFADIWSAETTNTYYGVLVTAQYVGAGLGPLVGGFLVKKTGGWRWTQYIAVCVIAAVWVFGLGIPESYQREIPRRRARRQGKKAEFHEDPPQSGVTLAEITRITLLDPIIGIVLDPVTMLSTLALFFNFAVVFQWFITVPVALTMAYKFTIARIGLAFLTAVVGSIMGGLSNILIEQVALGRFFRRGDFGSKPIERRLIPAMIGQLFITASLFWIGNTASPAFHFTVPIVGTAIFVWGNTMIVASFVPYLFDVYPPAGTLSAITAAAVTRIIGAGFLPIVILQFFNGVTPKWALSALGFISIGLWPIPFLLFFFGPRWRERSRFNKMPAAGKHMRNASSDDETKFNGV